MDPKVTRLFRLSLILFVVWLVLTWIAPSNNQKQDEVSTGVTVKATKSEYARGQLVQFNVINNTTESQEITLELEKRTDGQWQPVDVPEQKFVLEPREKHAVSFENENIAVFGAAGKFRVQLNDAATNEFITETEFGVEEPGFLRALWRGIFYKPLENALIFLLAISGKHLWIAIILLTLIIKLLLLIPSKKGIIAQQKMQKVQPELERVRKKYAHDPQQQAQEMMALWKKHKVHPGSALWPTLIQFPILISLFFVVREGLKAHNEYLLYPIPLLQSFDFSQINFDFLWLTLDKPDPFIILPLTIGLLQFAQLKTMNVRQKRKNIGKDKPAPTQQESMMKMMTYMLPGIVVFFSASLPAAVGLYWGVSTLFSITQQELIHRKGQAHTKHEAGDEIVIEAKDIETAPNAKSNGKKSVQQKKSPSKKKPPEKKFK